MVIFKDTIMIKDRLCDRAVEVMVIAPDGQNLLNVQELAEGLAVGEQGDHVGRVTVKVRVFRR